MISLGIEGTAEKTGVGIVDDNGNILSLAGKPLIPEKGGIHPREASEHHSKWIPILIKEAISDAEIELSDIDLISFSRGPGIPPALRTVATSARALSLSLNKPIIGVNHCIGHIEIGKLDTGTIDPVTLYASGGNSQIIAYEKEKYRVFGETLDIAIGNCLDHFARECGLSHPGGPIVEKLAKKGSYIDLPYTVKGMDFSFSGLLTSAIREYEKGIAIEDICFSLQETAFSSLVEVAERALSYTKKTELMLCGGVAVNKRLREMLTIMAEEHYTDFFIPKMELCGDNGAMIAWLGLLTNKYYGNNKLPQDLANTSIIQKYRTDEVAIPWMEELSKNMTLKTPFLPKEILHKGAEANIYPTKWLNQEAIKKKRIPKSYRTKELDEKIRKSRTKREAKILSNIKKYGIKTPIVLDIDINDKSIIMEKINGINLNDFFTNIFQKIDTQSNINKNINNIKNKNINANINFDKNNQLIDICENIGKYLAKLHNANIVHGDLTLSNIIYDFQNKNKTNIYFIDFGLAKYSNLFEDKADDLLVFKKSLQILNKNINDIFETIIDSYIVNLNKISKNNMSKKKYLKKIEEIENRGRYH
jgi:N6-L-threonylcarbamoyladenine synthase/protein kinase Bud32